MFIGRKNELAEMRQALATNKFEAIMLYGRRHVGKTEIIREALLSYPNKCVHFECKLASTSLNLDSLTILFCSVLNLSNLKFNSFDEFFDYAFKLSTTTDFALVIDEFSFLLENDPTIESSLAIAIDKYKNESKLKLIVSGSYVSIMQKMIEYGSHSYGRFTHILVIRPFDYFTSSLFYKNYSNEDKLKMYAVFGGIPYFNSLIDNQISAEDNIKNLIVKKDSILEHELNEMILAETNKVSNLNELIMIIGQGTTKQKDISMKIGDSKNNRSEYLLNKLIDLDIVKKVTPINDKNNKKRTSYYLNDNLMLFYFNYIFNSPYSTNRANPNLFFNTVIKNDFEADYLPKAFENIAGEFLHKANINGKINPIIMEIGKYTYNDKKSKTNREFDVVTKDSISYISYECKYTNRKINHHIINEELAQTQNLDLDFYKLGFISKNGFEADIDQNEYNCFSLADFYDFKETDY